jgi:hypothetical protein
VAFTFLLLCHCFEISLWLLRRRLRQQSGNKNKQIPANTLQIHQGVLAMIDTLTRGAALGTLLMTLLFAFAPPSLAQAPTDAQRGAIRSACRSDYEAHCASVPPGGMASLQCLQQNMSSLSSSCQAAVQAVEPAAASKAESTPAAEPAQEQANEPSKPAAETAARPVPSPVATTTPSKKPSSSQIAAIRSACRSDYQRSCASVPTGGAAALNCLQKNTSKLSAGCQQAVNAATGGPGVASAAAGDASTGAISPAAPALMLRPMRPREELYIVRSACGGDVRALCAGIPFGGGRIVRCLAMQAASLSPACRGVLSEFAAR